MEKIDYNYLDLLGRIATHSEDEIFESILKKYHSLKADICESISNYFTRYPLWGELNPPKGIYETFRQRAHVLKTHLDDFLWLYVRLADACSKNVLFAILSNWVDMNSDLLDLYTERKYPCYFDLEIFPKRQDEVFVDIGAYYGKSTISFIDSYGTDYKRIYCYEITQDAFMVMQQNLQPYSNIELFHKGAGAEKGILFLLENEESISATRLTTSGNIAVEVVRIDEDISEPATFIKMDIEGMEQEALRGCEQQIRENHPRLAISTYHGHEDICAVPRLIDDIDASYKFYMRYNGYKGFNLVPTEFVLLAV